MRIAQLSDLHVRRRDAKDRQRYDDWASTCISAINAAHPDLVLITGDLTDTGAEEEYRRLREILGALSAPHYVMPGNHDDPRALRIVYADARYLFENVTHLSYALDRDGIRILALDSMKRGRPGGYMDDERLSWLASELRRRPKAPVLLALHHPPFAAGVWPMDWLGFTKRDGLERVVRAHSEIVRIISGHVHCARAAQWAGTFACTSPSIRPQRLLIGVGFEPPSLCLERPGFLMHRFDAGTVAQTAVHRVDGRVELLEI